jgi:5-(carboxyamino)imidazole ribonucleotide synthase
VADTRFADSSDDRPHIGIIGGGQLARMLVQAGTSLDLQFSVLAGEGDRSIHELVTDVEVTNTYDLDTIDRFGKRCDVVTFEHELVEPEVLAEAAARGVAFAPTASTMEITSNKANQRKFLQAHHLPTPPFHIADSLESIRGGIERFGFPACIKTARGGFDGRGVFRIEAPEDLASIEETLAQPQRWVIEPYLNLSHEFAVITVRGADDALEIYEPLATRQEAGMCAEVIWPASIPSNLGDQAKAIAKTIAQQTGSIGAQTVEFFIANDELYVNELAPRVHNSGHLTIEAAVTSQFENHLRAIAGLPLGAAQMISPAAMVNIIGRTETQRYDRSHVLAHPRARIHLYHKAPRPRRKIGHVTVLDQNPLHALRLAREAATDALVDPTKESEQP